MQQLSTNNAICSILPGNVSPITIIPNEILVKIFQEYLMSYNSLIVPRLTCRSWRNIISSVISLPRGIYLSQKCKCEDLPEYHDYDYCCRSASHLRQALELVGDAHFELSIYLPILSSTKDAWTSVRWKKFETQCLGINVDSYFNYYSYGMISPLLNCLPSLRSLRFLTPLVFASYIMPKIDRSTNSLKAMEIVYYHTLGRRPIEPESIRDLLAELQSFSMPFVNAKDCPTSFAISLFSSFRNLKHLKWWEAGHNHRDVRTEREAVDWRFSLDRLETSYSLLGGFPVRPVLHQLKELVLRSSMKIPEFKLVRERLNLVHLTDLTLIRSWSGLTQIDAPNLERLELHSQREYRLPVVEDGGLLGTSLRPKSLSVHDDGTGSVLVPFLQGPFADIEELRVFSRVGWKEGSHLEKSLVDLLSDGMSWGQTVRWLTAVVPFGTGIPEADFDEIISRLEAMINRNRTTTRTINVRCSDMQHGW